MLMEILFSGYDLIEWLMERLGIEESGEFQLITCNSYFWSHRV